MTARPARWRRGVLLLALASLAPLGCREERPRPGPLTSEPQTQALPELELRDDTPHLLLTWVDEHGEFRTGMKIAEVPEAHREKVRVVVTTREEGTGAGGLLWVADLRSKKPDGTYPVTTMTRAAWDELGAARRKARLEALAPAPSAPASSAVAPPGSTDPRPAVPRKVVAIIYGAEWCKPCHDAARYLKGKGVSVVEKDIESSEAVAKELERKLERARMSGASIPIIEIGGRLLVGFSPAALDRAVAAAQAARPL